MFGTDLGRLAAIGEAVVRFIASPGTEDDAVGCATVADIMDWLADAIARPTGVANCDHPLDLERVAQLVRGAGIDDDPRASPVDLVHELVRRFEGARELAVSPNPVTCTPSLGPLHADGLANGGAVVQAVLRDILDGIVRDEIPF